MSRAPQLLVRSYNIVTVNSIS